VPGRIIVLNGPSSAGKSTLAKALQTRVGPALAAVAIDRLFAFMHPDDPKGWKLFAALTGATFASAAAIADGGYDVVVDTVFEREDCVATMHHWLGDRRRFLVGVTCPLEIIEAREQERANRPRGLARSQYTRVFHGTYDLTLDTHALTTDECVDRLVALLA
jgi:chloramphenicol 3-O phosphotransferase